jgi:hypothetical protein
MISRCLFGDNQRLGYASIGQSLRRQLSDLALAPREAGHSIARARGPVESGITHSGGFEHPFRSKQSGSRVFRMPCLFAKRSANSSYPVPVVGAVRRPDSAAQSRERRVTGTE